MTFLLGMQAMFIHAPPMYFRSIEAVRLPSRAIVHAINLPPVPLPSTRTSYLSGSLMLFISFFHQQHGTRSFSPQSNPGDREAVVWLFCRELAKTESI